MTWFIVTLIVQINLVKITSKNNSIKQSLSLYRDFYAREYSGSKKMYVSLENSSFNKNRLDITINIDGYRR